MAYLPPNFDVLIKNTATLQAKFDSYYNRYVVPDYHKLCQCVDELDEKYEAKIKSSSGGLFFIKSHSDDRKKQIQFIAQIKAKLAHPNKVAEAGAAADPYILLAALCHRYERLIEEQQKTFSASAQNSLSRVIEDILKLNAKPFDDITKYDCYVALEKFLRENATSFDYLTKRPYILADLRAKISQLELRVQAGKTQINYINFITSLTQKIEHYHQVGNQVISEFSAFLERTYKKGCCFDYDDLKKNAQEKWGKKDIKYHLFKLIIKHSDCIYDDPENLEEKGGDDDKVRAYDNVASYQKELQKRLKHHCKWAILGAYTLSAWDIREQKQAKKFPHLIKAINSCINASEDNLLDDDACKNALYSLYNFCMLPEELNIKFGAWQNQMAFSLTLSKAIDAYDKIKPEIAIAATP